MDRFDKLCIQHFLPTEHKIFDEVNGYIVIRWKVNTYVSRKEIINFSLAAIFCGKFFWRNESQLIAAIVDGLHLLIILVHLEKLKCKLKIIVLTIMESSTIFYNYEKRFYRYLRIEFRWRRISECFSIEMLKSGANILLKSGANILLKSGANNLLKSGAKFNS